MQDSVVMKVETSFDHVWIVRDYIDKIVTATGTGIRCANVSVLKDLPKKILRLDSWVYGSSLHGQFYVKCKLICFLILPFTPNKMFSSRFIGTAADAVNGSNPFRSLQPPSFS